MPGLETLEDLRLLVEGAELECKLAAGRDGRGRIPEDFWPTYSAFANTRGGTIILGIREREPGRFELEGVADPNRLISDLFNTANNPQRVSANLLQDGDAQIHTASDRHIILVRVRQATRKEKPVHTGSNPMTGTYRRLNDGDRRCDSDAVRRMLAEQVEDTRDGRILGGYGIEDLDPESLRTYRQALRDARPEHVALEQEGPEFLRLIGAWRRDRETGETGLTLAGLLMFGRSEAIWDTLPNYVVDYQEHIAVSSEEERWVDRITPDGTWSGNLYDFYRRAYRKLTADIKVPFRLEDGRRIDETSVHVALREALVNAIIHADYSGTASILVVKRPDTFAFRNPGLMRVPPDLARQGGDGDARNRALQQMFFLIGASDRAGTGVPTIYKGWRERGWLPPSFAQIEEPSDQTRLDLRMVDLLPVQVIEQLRSLFGTDLELLTGDQRLILVH